MAVQTELTLALQFNSKENSLNGGVAQFVLYSVSSTR